MSALEPITIVELRQPRCALRFGTYPCVAAIKTGTTRSNLCLYSEQLDNAAWTKNASTITANAGADPDGLTTADLLKENSANAQHYMNQTVAGLTVGQRVIMSCFVKQSSGTRNVTLHATTTSFGTAQAVRFDLSTGAVLGTSGGAAGASQDIGGGWWRIGMLTAVATATTGNFRVWLSDGSANTPTYLGNGTSCFFVWGVQIEVGTTNASTYKATTSAAVSATWGTADRYCHNTWGTCPTSATRAKIDMTGRIRWRFMDPRGGVTFPGDFADEDDIATPAIPVPGLSVRTSPASLNVTGIMEGKSPFGVTGTVAVTMRDFVWDDTWGDFYKASRGTLPTRTFWTTWAARNRLFGQMELVIYDGYVGEALADMRQRLYLVDGIDGPTGGSVTIRGSDPLRKARGKTALFPPAVAMTLYSAITASSSSLTVVVDAEASLSDTMGVSSRKFLRIGDELISYTGYSLVSAGIYTVTGLTRACGGTSAAGASAGTKVTRAGHFENVVPANIARYLLTDHTQLPTGYVDDAGWDEQIDDYLSIGSLADAWVVESEPVEDILGELCQQGQFMIWWDEWANLIRMKAVAPPATPVQTLTDDNAIVAGSAEAEMEPDSRLTRIFVYYQPIDWTKNTKANCRVVSVMVDGDGEDEDAGGEQRPLEIIARWIASESEAYQLMSRTFLRTRNIPRRLTVTLDAKDREIITGDVVDVLTRVFVDPEGNPVTKRWQVISSSPARPGQSYEVVLQDYDFGDRRYGMIMDNAANDYTSATALELAYGCYLANTDGTMSDGLDGYRIQ